jgi:hypothetical protein
MSVLSSDLFQGDPALGAALGIDSAHITPGAMGEHVKKIQAALTLLLTNPLCNIATDEMNAGRYGETTARAVLRYKTEHRIINFAYQTAPDDIIGKMTMRALDDAMVALEAEFGSVVLGILAYLDQLLLRDELRLSGEMRARIERLRGQALLLTAAGGSHAPSGYFAEEYQEGLRLMDDVANAYRTPIVFAALVVVGAAAALEIFLLVVAALIALLLAVELLIQSGKLGDRVSKAIQETIGAAEAAIIENVLEVDRLDAAVARCRQLSQNPSADCLDALKRFDTKKLEVVAKRNELQVIIQQMKNGLSGGPQKVIWKLLAKRAQVLGRQLAALTKELRDIVAEIIRKCGCQFIKL